MLAQIVDPNNDVFDFLAFLAGVAFVIGAYLGRADHGTVAARVGAALVAAALLFL